VLAAAGASITVLDLSPGQLAADREVALREGLSLRLDEGDMADLGRYPDAVFDLVFHPVSNCFVADPAPVWSACYRVLRPGGRLLAGFLNPAFFLFDEEADRSLRELRVRHPLPYSDMEYFGRDEAERRVAAGEALSFSHSLETQIGGQLEAGFLLAGLYEDDWDDEATALNAFMPTSIATLAVRPADG
jgi:SAM-dependent methyltransferase